MNRQHDTKQKGATAWKVNRRRLFVCAVLLLGAAIWLAPQGWAAGQGDPKEFRNRPQPPAPGGTPPGDTGDGQPPTTSTAQPAARPTARPVQPPVGASSNQRFGGPGAARPGLPAGAASAGEPGGQGLKVSEEGLYLDYKDRDLEEVVKSIGAVIGKNFDIDPSLVTTKVTIVSNAPVPIDMAYEVLESIVASRAALMLEDVDGHLIKIVPVNKQLQKAETSIDAEAPPTGFDRIYTYIVGVKYADATELVNLLQDLGSENARVNVYGITNTLIMTDTADGIRNMLEFLKQVDVPGFEDELEIFTLEYEEAAALSEQILSVLLGTGAGTGANPAQAVRQTVAARPVRAPVPGRKDQTIVGQREERLDIVANERLNALIVLATQAMMEQVRDLVERLDTPASVENNNLHVYHLLHADAEKMEETLKASLEGTTPRREGGQRPGQASARNTGDVQPFERDVTITMHEPSNSLLIVASPQDYPLIESIIAQMDIPPRQVHVEASILRVSIRHGFELAVEAAGLTAEDAFTLSNVTNLANILTEGGPIQALDSLTGTGGTVGILDGTMSVDIVDEATGAIVSTEVPKVPFLLKALETLTATDMLAQPSLTTIDNEESKILIGQDVPFVTGSQRSLDQAAVSTSSVYNSVQREDVGIEMIVKPQISEGDYVSLEMSVEVSEVVGSVGDVNVLGPTLDKTKVENIVVIKDGGTGMIGGLIQHNVSRNFQQIPYLGDIPLLGWLFRYRNDRDPTPGRSKQNLLVLVTPHIVKDGQDSERLATHKSVEMRHANEDVLFERNIIKKIKTKHYLRNKFRPTQEALDEMLQRGNGFDRGEVEN